MWRTTIQKKRYFAGLSQDELASALRVSRQTISAIENRRSIPSVTLAIAFAAALETTVEELFAVDPLRHPSGHTDRRTAPTARTP